MDHRPADRRDPRLRCCRLVIRRRRPASGWISWAGWGTVRPHRRIAGTAVLDPAFRWGRRWRSACSSTGTAAERRIGRPHSPHPRHRDAGRHQSLWRRVRRLADEPDGAGLRVVRVAAQRGKAILVAADALKFPGAMAVGDELSVYVDLLKQGRTSLRLKAEAIARERDGEAEIDGGRGRVHLRRARREGQAARDRGERGKQWLTPTTSSSSAPDPAAMSPRSARRSSASRPRSSSARMLGGICLNWGCIPTKALLRSAEVFHHMKPRRRLRPQQRQAVVRPRQGRRAQPRGGQAAQPGRHAPDEEEQDHGAHGRGRRSPARASCRSRRGRQGDRACRQAHHRRHRRPGARPAVRQGRRQAHLDLSPRDDPAGNADRAAGHRLGRDRDRVRQLLRRPGRQGDGGRNARPRRPGRGCGGQRPARQEPAEAGPDDPHQRRRREPEGRRQGRRRQDQDQATASRPSSASAIASSPSASSPTPRISGSRRSA